MEKRKYFFVTLVTLPVLAVFLLLVTSTNAKIVVADDELENIFGGQECHLHCIPYYFLQCEYSGCIYNGGTSCSGQAPSPLDDSCEKLRGSCEERPGDPPPEECEEGTKNCSGTYKAYDCSYNPPDPSDPFPGPICVPGFGDYSTKSCAGTYWGCSDGSGPS